MVETKTIFGDITDINNSVLEFNWDNVIKPGRTFKIAVSRLALVLYGKDSFIDYTWIKNCVQFLRNMKPEERKLFLQYTKFPHYHYKEDRLPNPELNNILLRKDIPQTTNKIVLFRGVITNYMLFVNNEYKTDTLTSTSLNYTVALGAANIIKKVTDYWYYRETKDKNKLLDDHEPELIYIYKYIVNPGIKVLYISDVSYVGERDYEVILPQDTTIGFISEESIVHNYSLRIDSGIDIEIPSIIKVITCLIKNMPPSTDKGDGKKSKTKRKLINRFKYKSKNLNTRKCKSKSKLKKRSRHKI